MNLYYLIANFHFLSILWTGMTSVTKQIMSACHYKWDKGVSHWLYKRKCMDDTPSAARWTVWNINMSGHKCNKKARFQLHCKNFSLRKLKTMVKSLFANAMKNLKYILVYITVLFDNEPLFVWCYFIFIIITTDLQCFNLCSNLLLDGDLCPIVLVVGASLGNPHHMRSTVKSDFSLACLFDMSPLIWLKVI